MFYKVMANLIDMCLWFFIFIFIFIMGFSYDLIVVLISGIGLSMCLILKFFLYGKNEENCKYKSRRVKGRNF